MVTDDKIEVVNQVKTAEENNSSEVSSYMQKMASIKNHTEGERTPETVFRYL